MEVAYPEADRGLLLGVLENSNGDEGVCMVFLAEMLGPPRAAPAGGQQQQQPPGAGQQGMMDYSQSMTTPRVMGAVVGHHQQPPAPAPAAPSGHNKALQDAMRRQNEELATAQRQLLDSQEKARSDRKRIAELEKKLREADSAQPAAGPPQSPQGSGEVTMSLLDMGLNMGVAAEPAPDQAHTAAADERLAAAEQKLANERATADQLRVDLTAAQARINSETEGLRRELQQKNLALEDAHDQMRQLQVWSTGSGLAADGICT